MSASRVAEVPIWTCAAEAAHDIENDYDVPRPWLVAFAQLVTDEIGFVVKDRIEEVRLLIEDVDNPANPLR